MGHYGLMLAMIINGHRVGMLSVLEENEDVKLS